MAYVLTLDDLLTACRHSGMERVAETADRGLIDLATKIADKLAENLGCQHEPPQPAGGQIVVSFSRNPTQPSEPPSILRELDPCGSWD